MKIYRDGQEYELTISELIEASREYKRDCAIEDVRGKCEQMNIDVFTEEEIEEIAEDAIHNLGKNDVYFDAYWETVKQTILSYKERKLLTAEVEDEE